MGSLVVNDVAHFPHAMFGHNSRLPSSHDSSAPTSHRSAPLRPTYGDASGITSHHAGPMDTPMADAGSRSATSTATVPRGRVRSYNQQSSPYTSQTQSSGPTPQQTPPSPRFAPQDADDSSQYTHSAQPSQTIAVPSSTTSTKDESPNTSPNLQNTNSPTRIKVTSLSHIQSFVLDESNPLSQSVRGASRGDSADAFPQYEISDMPVADVIEMVAGLLTKITTTNDRQHEHLHRQIPPADGTAHLSQQTTSVLAFHGKNIPSISILSYLSRIHKYCPTTYEVFLSLLVYFDRMANRVNARPMQSLRQANESSPQEMAAQSDGSRHSSVSSAVLTQGSAEDIRKAQTSTPPPSGSLGGQPKISTPHAEQTPPSPAIVIDTSLEADPYNLSHFFVVDSFNIHRLVIAGVTCASKFFSDIFYTNSRYAKVGGLPLPELNHLELQFLLLNDFRLQVPLEEMEAYGTMLVEFYAREILAQHGRSPNPNMVGGS